MKNYSLLINSKGKAIRIRTESKDIMAAILYTCISYGVKATDVISCIEIRGVLDNEW